MKVLKEFITYTNIKKEGKALWVLLAIASAVYCAIETVLMSMVYQIGHTAIYFISIYTIVLFAGYGFMVILFQFLQRKRKEDTQIRMRPYIFPYLKVQLILSTIMIGGSYLLYGITNTYLYGIMNAGFTLCILFYFPVQVMSMFFIYDGQRNSIIILKDSLKKIMIHYRSIFYSYILLVLVALGCSTIIQTLSGVGYVLQSSIMAMDLLIRSNPFMLFFELFGNMFDSISLGIAGGIALLYGILMHILFVFYFMFMACVYDEDIQV